jgi:hypothetical protein
VWKKGRKQQKDNQQVKNINDRPLSWKKNDPITIVEEGLRRKH